MYSSRMRVAGTPAAIAAAMIAPVDVPATKEKMSRVSFPVFFFKFDQSDCWDDAANAATVNGQKITSRHSTFLVEEPVIYGKSILFLLPPIFYYTATDLSGFRKTAKDSIYIDRSGELIKIHIGNG